MIGVLCITIRAWFGTVLTRCFATLLFAIGGHSSRTFFLLSNMDTIRKRPIFFVHHEQFLVCEGGEKTRFYSGRRNVR